MGDKRHDCLIVLAEVGLVYSVQSCADLSQVPEFDHPVVAARGKLEA